MTVLFGRSDELGVLQSAIETAAAGQGRLVVVIGEAGIGKTTLVDGAVAQARLAGLRVAAADAGPMDRHRPFGVWHDALASCPAVSGTQFQVVESLLQHVEQRCADEPLVLVIEDLHWADMESMVVLERLIRRLASLPLAVICSARPHRRTVELNQVLARVGARDDVVEVRLGPLSDPACAALVERVLGAPPAPGLMTQMARAGGNPLFLTELVTVLLRDGNIETGPSGTAQLRATARAPSLGLTLLRHLSYLAAPTREVLRLAAVLGVGFGMAELSAVGERSARYLAPLLQEAIDAGLLGERGDRLVFRHELIREALYLDIPAPVRVGLHRHAAQALLAAGASPASVAEHLLRGAEPGDAEAAVQLAAAAREVLAPAPRTAVTLWQRALEIGDPRDASRPRYRAGLAEALLAAGRPAEAGALCRELLVARPEVTPGGLPGVWSCLIRSLIERGNLAEAQAEIDRAAGSDQLCDTERADHLAMAARLCTYAGKLSAAVIAAQQAAAVAAAAGNQPAHVQALVTLGHVAHLRGDLADASRLLTQAVALAERSPAAHEASPLPIRALLLVDTDRIADALECAALGRQAAESFGSAYSVFLAHMMGAMPPLAAGRFDDTFAELTSAVTVAEEAGLGWIDAAQSVLALIALYRDGPAAAQARMERIQAMPTAPARYGVAWDTRARAEHAAAAGQPERARQLLVEGWRNCEHSDLAIDYPVLAPLLIAAAVNAGDTSLAGEVADRVADLARRNPGVASLSGASARARGLASGDADALLDALAAYREAPRRHEHARTAEEAAIALARQDRRTEAESLAAEALALQGQLSMPWEAARARAALRDAGLRPGVRGSRARPRSGWDALTGTELQVAELVAQRLSNPEIAARLFLSRRTVESHVSHILGKLALRSRAEIVLAAQRDPLFDGARQHRQ